MKPMLPKAPRLEQRGAPRTASAIDSLATFPSVLVFRLRCESNQAVNFAMRAVSRNLHSDKQPLGLGNSIRSLKVHLGLLGKVICRVGKLPHKRNCWRLRRFDFRHSVEQHR